MTQVRHLFLMMCGWLFLWYNVERLVAPINIASFVYVLTIVLILLIILLPKLYQLSLPWLLLMVLLPYFALKYLLGYDMGGLHLPITITELSGLGLTVVLAQQAGRAFAALHELLASFAIGPLDEEVHPFGTGQGQIYREIRRARRHQRPAALLAITATESADSPGHNSAAQGVPLHRFLEEVQRETLHKYVSARIANLLVAELGDLAIVTQRNDHFVTLLPETDRESLQEVIGRLQAAATEHLGLQFKIGVATFPDEAVTFETMLERAETAMTNGAQKNTVQVQPIAAKPSDAVRT